MGHGSRSSLRFASPRPCRAELARLLFIAPGKIKGSGASSALRKHELFSLPFKPALRYRWGEGRGGDGFADAPRVQTFEALVEPSSLGCSAWSGARKQRSRLRSTRACVRGYVGAWVRDRDSAAGWRYFTTISRCIGASFASSWFCARKGMSRRFIAICRSSTSALKSARSMPSRACACFMSRPV
jgi:hypothetical protein